MYGHSAAVVARLTAWLTEARAEITTDHPEFADRDVTGGAS